jgi:uncharacterized membrane protein
MRVSIRLNAHRRLLVSLAIFIAFAAALVRLPIPLRIAIGWDAGALTFLGLTWLVIRQCRAGDMRETVLANDQGRLGVLMLVLLAIGASVAAIFFLLEKPKDASGPAALQVTFAAATIACSWLFMHVMFALHYAHRFYRDNPTTAEVDATGGLKFPGDRNPDYLDFMYFSFVIGMTSQVSDVQVTSRGMRRLVMGHGVLSFAFYTVILALCINIVAGLI